MSDPDPTAVRPVSRLFRHAWWLLLLVALALLALAADRRIAHVDALTNEPTWSVDAPRRDASSPTGFERGQRTLIVPGHHNPSFWWIMEAQLAAAHHQWRLRHINYDAPPAGRDIRRTAPYRWWLTAVGWLHARLFGESLGLGIERGALIADPLLFALLLVAGAAYGVRRLGTFAGVGFVVGGISLFPLAVNFQPGAPDPHALAWVLALGSVLPLLAAAGKPETGGPRRADFAIAGIFGGLGFWNDATSQAPVLVAIFLGALGAEFVRSRRGGGEPASAPFPWRTWASAGALTTLAASVFEFAPHHFSWSLDAVNPIHAAAWWGSGELLLAAAIGFRDGWRGFNLRRWVLVAIALLAVGAWPFAGVCSHSGGLLASDFYARELANDPSGAAAPGLGAWLGQPGHEGAKWATLLPCVLLLLLPLRALLGRCRREQRAGLAFVTLAALLVLVLAFQQLRWWNLFDVLALAGLTALFATTGNADRAGRWTSFGAALLLLPGLFTGFPSAATARGGTTIAPPEAQALVERDFAYWLVQHSGPDPVVLFSTPVFAGAAAFYGGFDVADSTDEDNKTGFLTAVRVASASDPEEISLLLNAHRITDLALPLWDPALDGLVRIGMALPAGTALPQGAFAVALRSWALPLWMRPVDYLIPNKPGFDGFDLRVFALQPEQEPELAVSRLADFFVQRGQLLAAQALKKNLEEYPRSVVALGALASVELVLRDRAGLDQTLATLIPYLSRRAARDLPVDRRIGLATLFVRTNHADLARDQLTAAFKRLDAKTLRTLTPGSLVNLVALSRSLGVSFPDKNLEATALELIPPAVRGAFAHRN